MSKRNAENYEDLTGEERAFWRECYATTLGGVLAGCPYGCTPLVTGVADEAERHAWEAVYRMRSGS